ncbi:MAG: YdhR family protein [Erythrobacter sp.]
MPVILFVRIATDLDRAEIERRMAERAPAFQKVRGLVGKRFGYDETTGNICGSYVFDSRDALEAYLGSDLAASIPQAYEAMHVRRETFDLVRSVKGPE